MLGLFEIILLFIVVGILSGVFGAIGKDIWELIKNWFDGDR